jgi:hypothetical protein
MERIFFIQIDQKQTHIKFCTMFHVLKFRSENEEVKVLGSEIELYWRQMLPKSILCVIKKIHMAWTRLKNDRRRLKQFFAWITLGKMKEEDQGLRLVK